MSNQPNVPGQRPPGQPMPQGAASAPPAARPPQAQPAPGQPSAAAQPQARPAGPKGPVPLPADNALRLYFSEAQERIPEPLRSRVRNEIEASLQQSDPDQRVKASQATWHELTGYMLHEDRTLAAAKAPDEAGFAERVASMRMHLNLVREGITTEQTEWIQHRIPAQQLEVLRRWWPTDGATSEYLSADDIAFEAPQKGARFGKVRLNAATLTRFGNDFFLNLYGLVAHNFCATQPRAAGPAGQGGLLRALDRHFDVHGRNQSPFERHGQSLSELRTKLMAHRPNWPEWQDTRVASDPATATPDMLAHALFDANDGSPRTNLPNLPPNAVSTSMQRFIRPAHLYASFEALAVDYRRPKIIDGIMKNLRESAVLLTVGGVAPTLVDSSGVRRVVITVVVFAIALLLIYGVYRDIADARENALRSLDQRLYQTAVKELRAVADAMVREVRAFHTNNLGQMTLEVEEHLRLEKAQHDKNKAAYAAMAQTRPKLAQAKKYVDGMRRAVDDMCAKRGI